MNKPVIVRRIGVEEAAASIDSLADLLIDCVEGGASVGFMLPLPREKAMDFWHSVIDGVGRAERALLIAEANDCQIVGTVQMIVSMPDNQPHRADIVKMLVLHKARRRGIGRQLLAAVEEAARNERKSVLVLDTATGSDAEKLYERAEWQRVGIVPKYALMPNGALSATTFFYKHL